MLGHTVQHLESSNASQALAPHAAGGGKHNIGYAALKWEAVLQGSCGTLGLYPEIALLPRKTAIFLFEYHGPKFKNVLLPRLPTDRSRTDVHALLKDEQVFNV